MSEEINHRRRHFFRAAVLTMAAAQTRHDRLGKCTSRKTKPTQLPVIKPGTNTSFGPLKQIDAGVLNVGYAEAGPANGRAVILLHGWPYDIHSFVDVTPLLASAGYRVIVPYVRGYGTTRLSFQRDRPQCAAVGDRNRYRRFYGCPQDREGDPSPVSIGAPEQRTSWPRSGRSGARLWCR